MLCKLNISLRYFCAVWQYWRQYLPHRTRWRNRQRRYLPRRCTFFLQSQSSRCRPLRFLCARSLACPDIPSSRWFSAGSEESASIPQSPDSLSSAVRRWYRPAHSQARTEGGRIQCCHGFCTVISDLYQRSLQVVGSFRMYGHILPETGCKPVNLPFRFGNQQVDIQWNVGHVTQLPVEVRTQGIILHEHTVHHIDVQVFAFLVLKSM